MAQPEPAQRPPPATERPEAAQRETSTSPAPAAHPVNVVEQTNNYYIDGVGDVDAVLAAAERSATRMVRELA